MSSTNSRGPTAIIKDSIRASALHLGFYIGKEKAAEYLRQLAEEIR